MFKIKKKKIDDYKELRSDEINDILGQPPKWLIRWGSAVFFLVIISVFIFSWFVHYPDIIKGEIKVLTNNLPKSVVIKSDGRLIDLFIKDGQVVYENQPLGYIESVADHKEVLSLDSVVNNLVNLSLHESIDENLYRSSIQPYFQLGELQRSYQSFHDAFIRIRSQIDNGLYLQKKEFLTIDLKTINSLRNNLLVQQENAKQEYSIAQEEFDRQKNLLRDKIISKNEYNQLVAKALLKKQNFDQISNTLKSQDISINQKKQEILELDKSIVEYKNTFEQSLYALKSDIETWKRKYIITAPSSGKIIFLQTLQENQAVRLNQELLYILPSGEGFHAEMNIGQFNFGKVKLGQKVIVKFQSFPYEEYGSIVGQVESISDIPVNSLYFIRVKFPSGLSTSANKNIPFKNGMIGSGEIVTDNRRLILRLMDKLIKAFER